jgi:hypothetical protein
VLVYSSVTTRPRPENLIPLIGSLFGADTRSSVVVFQFDQNGILKSANSTTSNVDTGLGKRTHNAPIRSVEPPAEKSIARPPGESVDASPEQ